MTTPYKLEDLNIYVRDYEENGNLHGVYHFNHQNFLKNISNQGYDEDVDTDERTFLLPTVRANVSIRHRNGKFVSFRECEPVIREAVENVRPSHDPRWELVTEEEA